MRLVVYGFVGLPIAVLLAYVIWLRRVVLDIPVGLRLGLSVIPSFVLYRAVTLLIYRRSGFVVILTGITALVLYHLWRDVRLDGGS
ncbi:MAG TPA: hypothetical protein VKU19_13715 [Bryobacteraceae bacterium]|nr:hypothetical protein [Bryobacteraceae bacterium]